jgi:CelD/BcsL family acetyltransferase involved in cellulose biosynthesis
MEGVTVGSALHRALAKAGAGVSGGQQTVVIDLRPYTTMKDFSQSVNSKTRKNMRNLMNRLRRVHAIEHRIVLDNDAMGPLVRKIFDERFAWLQKNGRTSPAFRDSDFRRIVEILPRVDGVRLLGLSLETSDATLSAQWGFLCGDRYYAYMSAMNANFFEYSPGRLHLGMVIEYCWEHGVKVLELMPPAVDYKLAWSEEVRQLQTLTSAFTLKGRIALGFSNAVMPALQRTSRLVPENLRKTIIRRLNRT